jgi:RNA ligase (TIGR02306 family)
MTETTRKLASIREINEIRPIPEADAIECAMVGGWPVVVKKGEYKVGDLAIYLEIDSWVPHKLAPFLSKGREPREYNGVKGERLRTVKLRGQLSQGLLIKPSDIPLNVYALVNDETGEPYRFDELVWEMGADVTAELDIQKWEPPIPAQLQGVMKGNFPSFIPKTDQERCQNLARDIFVVHEKEEYEVTTKLDGSSMTVYVRNGEFGVCSRNIDLKETEGNSFWAAARKQSLIEALLKVSEARGEDYTIQGELIGEGIQNNPEKLKGQKFFLFDVYNITEGCYLSPEERREFLWDLNDQGATVSHVPILKHLLRISEIAPNGTVEELLEFAEGPSLNPDTKREGVVFKSTWGNFSFKAISNSYLLKHKDR